MVAHRIGLVVIFVIALTVILYQWNVAVGFDAMDSRWWDWLFKNLRHNAALPEGMFVPVIWTTLVAFVCMTLFSLFVQKPGTRTLHGGKAASETHGSARWAGWKDLARASLLGRKGVIVGGFKRRASVRPLLDNGPEHIMCFAPTRTGKGIGLVVPTLLRWRESAFVLDIKGENLALTSGWRSKIGQRILKFDPAAPEGSIRYNPLAEIRKGTDYEVADCQNIASMIIDPDGKGLKDFWMESGWGWLSGVILHVVYYYQIKEGRIATLADIHDFMSVGQADNPGQPNQKEEESFNRVLDGMAGFEHGEDRVDAEISRCAGQMSIKAANERSGIHSSAAVKLALYSDPIVARNTSESDFRISDLMNGKNPTTLYYVVQPEDMDRLRPLTRILLNQIMSRLMGNLEFKDGVQTPRYNHRLLLMLDEFTSVSKLEKFETALAFMAGYGLKAYIIVQDLPQLEKLYGKDNAILSNCRIRIAYTPNNLETAERLSGYGGKTTITQAKQTRSHSTGRGRGVNVSESVTQTGRQLITADECMVIPMFRKSRFLKRIIPGDMLIFIAGNRPVYGKQYIFFKNRVLRKRSAIPSFAHPPDSERPVRLYTYEYYLKLQDKEEPANAG